MADEQQLAAALSGSIQATPRNPVLGGVADLLGMAYKLPEMPRMGVPGIDFLAANRKKVLDLLGMGDVQKTADTLSYGGAIGTGSGMTYRPKDETIGAAMAIAPMVAPAARMAGQGAVATGRFVAPKAGQLAEQYMVKTGGILPLDVYHGSPHTFPPTARNPLGEFDASKIGTGEGAQAYGHGLYLAESPAVAQGYRDKLTPAAGWGYDGKAATELDKATRSAATQLSAEMRGIGTANGWPDVETAKQMAARKLTKQGDQAAANVVLKLDPAKIGDIEGSLYKVDLPDEKIAKMLDWDKPLSEQPEVFAAIKRAGYNPNPEMKAGDFIVAKSKEGFAPYLSDDLVKQGIPGIQYLDSGSRNVAGGTRNFVVFPGEEKSMTILERNAQKK